MQPEVRSKAKNMTALAEFVHWFAFTVGFSCIPFIANALFLLFTPDAKVTIAAVFQSKPLLFLGFVICGTILERLNSYPSCGPFDDMLCKLGCAVYAFATIVLAITFGRHGAQQAPAPLEVPMGLGGVLSPDKILRVFSSWFIAILLPASSIIYWLTYYVEKHARSKESGGENA